MRKIGNTLGFLGGLFLAFVSFADDVEFYQAVDRNELGMEDTVRLTVTSVNAPGSAQVQLPSSTDFEVLSQSQNSQTSFQLGGGGPGMLKRMQQYLMILRPNRTGLITIPPAVLVADRKTYKSEAVDIMVKKGHIPDPNGARSQRGSRGLTDPFRRFPFPNFPGDDDQLGFPNTDVPHSESDLFMRATLDKEQVYVGEQVMLSLFIFSRVDLSSVDAVNMPKLDGFWSEDLESPQQLASEQRMINGVPYRAYLLKRRALFPVKTGTINIGPTEAEITTGFLFAGRRLHRVSNDLNLKVKPLPPGAPPGMSNNNVGRWRLSVEAPQTRWELGQPATVKIILEGQGNLKNIVVPPLTLPPGLRGYDPTTTDKIASTRSRFGGRRTLEYLITAQQTGTFTLPALQLPYFDPDSGHYEVSSTAPVSIVVVPGTSGAGIASGQGALQAGPKNVLSGGGLKPLRYRASFSHGQPVSRRTLFAPAVIAPPAIWLGLAVLALIRDRLSIEDEASRKKKKTRAARARLGAAQKIVKSGSANEFYGEVEKALIGFLEVKLGVPVGGLTRESLKGLMEEKQVAPDRQQAIFDVLEACDLGRFAPGAIAADRGTILDEAAQVMGGW